MTDELREEFTRYKRDVEERGKPFHPYAMFHDTVMSLVVVSVITALACVWYFTAGEDPEESGWLGRLYDEKADPGTTSFVPRPDWYFYFLFYLLRIFKWPDSVILGTVGIPTIALILLIGLPFLDRRAERHPLRRPVAMTAMVLTAATMAVFTYKGATASESLGSEALQRVPGWMEELNLPDEARPGAELFAESGCLNCHTYAGDGSANLGAPDLTAIGRQRNRDFLKRYIANPREFDNAVMPVYGESLTEEELDQIALFLEASKGTGG